MPEHLDTAGSSAAFRLGTNRDLPTLLTSHPDRSSLLACLTTSTHFHLAAVPHLYHTIGVKRDLNPSWERTYCQTRGTARMRHFGMSMCLTYSEHEADSCPGIVGIPELESLQILHFASGGRPPGLDVELCKSDTCSIVTSTCQRVKSVVLRTFSSGSQSRLPRLPEVQKIILKIRSCQLPIPYGRHNRSTFFSIHKKSIIRSGLWSASTELDLIFWDVRHDHRIDLRH
jgi:hypothetical protein